MDRREILEKLREFPYGRGEYWVITGGAMVLYGIREQTHDVDLGCTRAMADHLEADGFVPSRTADGKRKFRYGDDVEIFEDWLRGTVETVEGFPVISIGGLIQMKEELGREKDRRDLALIREYLEKRDPGGEGPGGRAH